MAEIKEFVAAAYSVYENNGIYLWSGNGEPTEGLTIGKIRSVETSEYNAGRVLKHISDLYKKEEDLSLSKAVDCSGLVVYALRTCGAVSKNFDKTARGLQADSEAIPLDKLQLGDCVFNKKKNATHVGIYDGECVIEAQGRDVGVTRRSLSAGKWAIGGRLPYFKEVK